MRAPCLIATVGLLLLLATPCLAQFKKEKSDPKGPKTGQSQVTRYRAGLVVKATGGACRGATGFVPVPADWPEQEVNIVDEEKTGGAKINYEMVDGSVKVMSIHIGHIGANEEAKAVVTFELRRSTILPPDDTSIYKIVELASCLSTFADTSRPAR